MCRKKGGPREPLCPQKDSGPVSPTWNSVHKCLLKISVPFRAAWLLFSLSSLSLCWPPALSKTVLGSSFASDESRPPGFTWIFPLLSLYLCLYLDDQRSMCDVGCWQVNLFLLSLSSMYFFLDHHLINTNCFTLNQFNFKCTKQLLFTLCDSVQYCYLTVSKNNPLASELQLK